MTVNSLKCIENSINMININWDTISFRFLPAFEMKTVKNKLKKINGKLN